MATRQYAATIHISVTVTHAIGVRSTLHNYFVDLDLTPDQAATNIPAIIGVAGPLFSLALGITAWVAFKRARGSAAELPLLFFTVFGIGTFFGNLMSASFIGDFSRVAVALHLPMPARYALSLVGVVGTAAVHFMAGRELARWIPPTMGRAAGTTGIIAVPVIIGMAIVILANIPTANASVRTAEAAFWIFAAIGAFVGWAPSRTLVDGAPEGTPYVPYDVAALLLAIVIVRLLVRGIPFVP